MPRTEEHEPIKVKEKNITYMKGSLPKRYPQTLEQMHEDNMRRKETRVYKKMPKEGREERISALINRGMNALLNADEMGKLPLADTERVKEQTMVYLHQCEEDGVLPDKQSFCLALGHTTSSIDYWIRTRPDNEPTRAWLVQTLEMISALVAQSAMNNDVNNIFAIFTEKANHGWREEKHIVVENVSPLGLPKTEKELKQIESKYAVDAKYEEVKDGE